MGRVLVVTLVVLFAGPAEAADKQSAKDVVARVQKFYKDTVQYKAVFKQIYWNDAFGTDDTSSGRVRAKSPGKMRWDYSKNKKTTKTFRANGKRYSLVDHEDKQVFTGKATNRTESVALSFLLGRGDLAKEFTAAIDKKSKYGEKGDIVLRLKPKKVSARYTKLYLVVSGDDYRVKRSIVVEASGNTNSIQFFEPDRKTELDDELFRAPMKQLKKDGYKIIK